MTIMSPMIKIPTVVTTERRDIVSPDHPIAANKRSSVGYEVITISELIVSRNCDILPPLPT